MAKYAVSTSSSSSSTSSSSAAAENANLTYFDQVVRDQPFGWKYTQPQRSPYFSFEELDHFFWPKFIEANRIWALYAGVIYIVTIFGLQRWMRNRPAYQLRTPLFLWNAGLGIFSILGFWRTVPGLLFVLFGGKVKHGFYKSICMKEEMEVQTSYWVLLFALSKFVELGDTLFIVLRKRPLIFLQWYHHLVTMSVVWVLAPFVEPIARWYTVLNYGVHSLMYPYFALRAIGVHVPTYIAHLITTLQLAQMVIGLSVNLLSLYYQQTGHDCVRYTISIQLFSFVYGSFLLLFGKLFYDSVLRNGRKLKEKSRQMNSSNKKID